MNCGQKRLILLAEVLKYSYMTTRQKTALKQLDRLIAIRRREVIANIFEYFIFRFHTVPDWDLNGDIASDYVMNFLQDRKDKIANEALKSRNPKYKTVDNF